VSDAPTLPSGDVLLTADGVHRSFGGLRAVDVEHMDVERGSVTLRMKSHSFSVRGWRRLGQKP